MKVLDTPQQMQAWALAEKGAGRSVAFVPTMGNLHSGHLRLVEEARQHGARVVVSIFVNPLQFGAGEDYDKYPRTFEQDSEQLKSLGVDALFFPSKEDMYPNGKESSTQVEVPTLGDVLCGASRPGHFRGVTTIVAKLFNIVQPDVAVFGEKDFQQLMLIRRMVADLFMPIRIVGVATQRESSGLALSSRNGYLSDEQRQLASELYRTLQQVGREILMAPGDFRQSIGKGVKSLEKLGFEPEYLELRSVHTLQELATLESGEEAVLVLAARLGGTRLIDNLRLTLK